MVLDLRSKVCVVTFKVVQGLEFNTYLIHLKLKF
jgi:hypothetical protein